jgi:hypothetical protein
MNTLIILAWVFIGLGLFGVSFELLARRQERKRDAAIIPWKPGKRGSA